MSGRDPSGARHRERTATFRPQPLVRATRLRTDPSGSPRTRSRVPASSRPFLPHSSTRRSRHGSARSPGPGRVGVPRAPPPSRSRVDGTAAGATSRARSRRSRRRRAGSSRRNRRWRHRRVAVPRTWRRRHPPARSCGRGSLRLVARVRLGEVEEAGRVRIGEQRRPRPNIRMLDRAQPEPLGLEHRVRGRGASRRSAPSSGRLPSPPSAEPGRPETRRRRPPGTASRPTPPTRQRCR